MHPCVDTFGYQHRGFTANRCAKCRQNSAFNYVFWHHSDTYAKSNIISFKSDNQTTVIFCITILILFRHTNGRHSVIITMALWFSLRHNCQHARSSCLRYNCINNAKKITIYESQRITI